MIISASPAPAMDKTSGYDAFPAIPFTSKVSTARATNSELLSTTVTSFFSDDKWRAICQPT